MIKKVVPLFFLLALATLAKEMTLEELLLQVENRSNEKQVYSLTVSENDINEKALSRDNYNGVTVSGNLSKRFSDDKKLSDDNYMSSAKVKYGDFYISGTKNHAADASYSVGVEKSLNDLFYSKSSSDLAKMTLNKKIAELNYLTQIETKQISLVGLYRDYLNGVEDLNIKNNALTLLKRQNIQLSAAVKAGSGKGIDLQNSNTNIATTERDIVVLKNQIERTKERFLIEYGIDLSKDSIKDLNIPNLNVNKLIDNYGKKDLMKADLEKESLLESKRFSAFQDKTPDISAGVEYNSQSEESRIFMSFAHTFGNINSADISNKYNIEEKDLAILKLKDDIATTKLRMLSTYESNVKEYENAKSRMELQKAQYNIKLIEFDNGKGNFIDLSDSFNKYTDSQVAVIKAKNSLNAYIYELIIRGKYE